MAIGLLAIVAAGGYPRYFIGRPICVGPAGPNVPRSLLEGTWTEREILLVAIGDSVTKGFGAREGYGYMARLVASPADKWEEMRGVTLSAVLPNLSLKNIAVSGSNSLQHINDIQQKSIVQNDDGFGLVVMTTGGNDSIHNYGRTPPREGAMYGASLSEAKPWVDAFETRLSQMLDLLNERFPDGCAIFVADIYDPTDGDGDVVNAGLPPWTDGVAIHNQYNKIIYRCAKSHQNVFVVPMYNAFLGHGIHLPAVLAERLSPQRSVLLVHWQPGRSKRTWVRCNSPPVSSGNRRGKTCVSPDSKN